VHRPVRLQGRLPVELGERAAEQLREPVLDEVSGDRVAVLQGFALEQRFFQPFEGG
jgi:hypothetical protein